MNLNLRNEAIQKFCFDELSVVTDNFKSKNILIIELSVKEVLARFTKGNWFQQIRFVK